MGECTERQRVETTPRSTTGREWEVFIRGNDDVLRHAGSVSASDPEDAHGRVGQLFDWAARDVWVCPTEEIARFVTDGVTVEEEEDQ